MDVAKKAALEKRIVIGLVGVFAVTLVTGPLRSLRLFTLGPSTAIPPKGATAVPAVAAGATQPETSEQLAASQPVTANASGASAARGEAAYTAYGLRDPFKNLLPQLAPPPLPASTAPAAGPVTQTSPPQGPPLPPLQIQGVLWGGPKPLAIINGKLYGIDDVVEGGKILSIDRQGITVDFHGVPASYSP